MSKRTEEFTVSGEELVKKVQELIKEGNIRRITVKGKDGHVIAEFPLMLGMIGAVLAAPLAALAAIAALVTECTIAVEREG